jgi:stearoyl-CoA desaturase (delta-9 desaturase)
MVQGLLIGVVIGLGLSQIGLFLTTVVLHRSLSHKALKLAPWAWAVCRVLIWVLTGIRPRQWVAVHRKHHAYTDVAGDPHSPVLTSYAAVQFGNVAMYRRVAKEKATVARYAKDLPPDRWDTLLFDHALLGLGLGVAILTLAVGWEIALVAAVVHAVSYLFLNAAINAVGHTWGRRPNEGLASANQATNNQWLAFLTAGEGLHNNHHAASTSAKLAFRRGEIDPGWWVIALGRKLRWLTVRHEIPKLRIGQGGVLTPPTPELV